MVGSDSKNKLGTVALQPEGDVVAGSWGTWDIVYTVGSQGMAIGGGLRILPPYEGMTRWELGRVVGFTSRPGAGLAIKTENTNPISYHWRHPPVVEVTVTGCPLKLGDTITVRLGERGMVWSGFRVRTRVPDFAMENAEFHVYVDFEGKGQTTRELQVPEPYILLENAPKVNIVPDKPAKLKVCARATTGKGTVFPLMIFVEDQYGNAVSKYEGTVKLESTDPKAKLPVSVDFLLEDNGAKTLSNCKVTHGEVHYIAAYDLNNSLIGRSNPISVGFAKPYQIYFGDPHVMTGRGGMGKKGGSLLEQVMYMKGNQLGDTHGAFLYGRNKVGLDFVCVTNCCQTEDVWKIDQAEAEAFNEPYRFVTLVSFELGTAQGHRNVYFQQSPQPFFSGKTFQELFDFLEGKVAMTIPHHTNTCSESAPEAWSAFVWATYNPKFDRLVEITQLRGPFETDDKREGEYFGGFGSSVQDALARGYRVGFVGGSDNHRAQPGSKRCPMAGLDPRDTHVGGLTAVMAPELTRKAIWEALWNRRCYATSGERILLKVDVNGHMMGEAVKMAEGEERKKARTIYAKVVGTDKIKEIDVVRNNLDVYTHVGKGVVEEFKWTDRAGLTDGSPAIKSGEHSTVFYYLRVIQEDGEKAWSSPIWFLF